MGHAAERPRVLFLCTGNSCRSLMAEGWARALRPGDIDAYSAGTNPQGMNRLAVRAMAEAGVDISRHESKHLDALSGITFDYVVTVCGNAHESCPVFTGGAKVVHFGFDDPPALAKGAASDDEAMPHYRRVRDEIRRFVETLPQALTQATRRGPSDFVTSLDVTARKAR
jgi:arsenate reductase (thioredoxin)